MASFSRSNKIILAESQAVFRGCTAKELAVAEDMRIVAHCADLHRMYNAIADFPGSILLFAASLQPDLIRLQILLETTGSRGIVLAENSDGADKYLQMGFSGVVFRRDNGRTLVECVHRVAIGDFWLPAQLMEPEPAEEDRVGIRMRDQLTPSDMRLLSKVALGLTTRMRVGVGENMRPFGTA